MDGMGVGKDGGFGVPDENDNGRRVIDFCAERGLCVGDTYLEDKSYTSTAGWLEAKMEWKW